MEVTLPDDKTRFEAELEFVQCLGNPRYLNYLAQHGYFEDEAFVKFLKYLMYWKDRKYSRYLKYPHCLDLLDLLQDAKFRGEMSRTVFAQIVEQQQLRHWLFYNKNRTVSLSQ